VGALGKSCGMTGRSRVQYYQNFTCKLSGKINIEKIQLIMQTETTDVHIMIRKGLNYRDAPSSHPFPHLTSTAF
jgi:hypothetical protein